MKNLLWYLSIMFNFFWINKFQKRFLTKSFSIFINFFNHVVFSFLFHLVLFISFEVMKKKNTRLWYPIFFGFSLFHLNIEFEVWDSSHKLKSFCCKFLEWKRKSWRMIFFFFFVKNSYFHTFEIGLRE